MYRLYKEEIVDSDEDVADKGKLLTESKSLMEVKSLARKLAMKDGQTDIMWCCGEGAFCEYLVVNDEYQYTIRDN